MNRFLFQYSPLHEPSAMLSARSNHSYLSSQVNGMASSLRILAGRPCPSQHLLDTARADPGDSVVNERTQYQSTQPFRRRF